MSIKISLLSALDEHGNRPESIVITISEIDSHTNNYMNLFRIVQFRALGSFYVKELQQLDIMSSQLALFWVNYFILRWRIFCQLEIFCRFHQIRWQNVDVQIFSQPIFFLLAYETIPSVWQASLWRLLCSTSHLFANDDIDDGFNRADFFFVSWVLWSQ